MTRAFGLPTAGKYDRSVVFALAGDDSVDLPERTARAATDRGVDARALLRLPDGRVLIAQPRDGYLVVDTRGRAARPAGSARWPAHPKDMALTDDGAILITDGKALWRAARGSGRVSVLAGDPGATGAPGEANPTGVAVLADGAVLWSDRRDNRVLRRGADGRNVVVAGADLPAPTRGGGLAVRTALEEPRALATYPDGSFLVAEGPKFARMRVRRVGADGRISTVAGGGRRDLMDRCPRKPLPARAVELSSITDLVALADGGFLVVDDGSGVWRVSHGGTLRAVLCGPANVEPSPPAGRPVSRAHVRAPQGAALLADGTLLVAQTGMVAMVPDAAGTRRLGVALTRSRAQLATGQAVVTSTRRATVTVRLHDRSGPVLAAGRRVPAGRSRLQFSAPVPPGVNMLRLSAGSAGRTAVDHLRVVVPDPERLNPEVVRDAILRWHDDEAVGYDPKVTCLSVDARTVSCRKRDVLPPEGFVIRERWTVSRGPDGRLRAQVQDLNDPGAAPERVILEG